MDYKPRKFDAECCNILANFAEMVVRDVERYAAAEQHAELPKRSSFEQVRCNFNSASALGPHAPHACLQTAQVIPHARGASPLLFTCYPTLCNSSCDVGLFRSMQTRLSQQLVRSIDAKPDGYILCNPHLERW